MTSLVEPVARQPDNPLPSRGPSHLRLVTGFLLALSALLAGYMFLGRGFAHIGRPPIYVGEIVLFVGLAATAFAFVRLRLRLRLLPVVWLLIAFMVLGFARSVPYLGVYGVDALRDAVLWGYAIFALMIYVLADRAIVLRALRLYGWVVPVFALWLPISYKAFAYLSAGIQADQIGSNVPIVFFKGGDMAVHIVGSVAFLVLGAGAITRLRTFAWHAAVAVPLLWIALVAGAANRGALVTVVVGLAGIAALAIPLRRSRNWAPLLLVPVVLALVLGAIGMFSEWSAGATDMSPPAGGIASASGTTASPDQSSGEVTPACDGAPSSRSLVANSGFEVGSVNDGKIEGWTTWAGVYNIVGGGGFRGANYASVQNTGEPGTATITSTTFPVQAGHDLSVSLWAEAIDGSPVIATYVNWYASSDALISTVFLNSLATNGHGTWQESKGALSAPAGATHADVQLFEVAGNATVGLDEVMVKSGTMCDAAPASRSLIANPGFEFGILSDGRIEEWTTWAGVYNIVGGGGYRGTNYASVQNTGETTTITSTMFRVQAGLDVSVSLWAKAVDGSPVIATFVNWYDSSDTLIAAVFLNSLATEGRSTWQQTGGAFAAPTGTTHADVQLFEAAGNATVGLDEVIVKSGHFVLPGSRPATIDQIMKNITSIFSTSPDTGLEGTKAFRLKWWGTIIDYTVFGDYFWTGKGFGINLADADGFQVNLDHSLRTPHNTHITTLARMGVPGFVLWVLLQGAFGIGLLRSVLAHRRAGITNIAIVGAWILVYWVAMLVNTSFDPYLEGPQGGIWFWTLFGLGMVVMRLSPTRPEA